MRIGREIYKKDIIIYGSGKPYKDFQYMFSELKIVSVIDKISDYKKVKTDKSFLIVCKYNEELAGKEAESYGLSYGREYCLASDLFYLLEPIQLPAKIYVWGCGQDAKTLYQLNKRLGLYEAIGYIDNSVGVGDKGNFFEYTVWNPANIDFNEECFILVATTKYYQEIKDELQNRGLKEGINFIKLDLAFGKTADMMWQTYFDFPDIENQFICKQPFEYVQVGESGAAYCCCPDLIYKKSMGSMSDYSFNELWDSNLMKVFRLSILNGTYTFCNHKICYVLRESAKSEEAERGKYVYEPKRLKVSLNVDGSCNLYCTSCRKSIYVKKDEEVEAANILAAKCQREIIPKATDLYLSGYGEVFLSKVYRKILRDIVSIDHIGLLTNGTLFDREFFEEIRKKCNRLSIFVSVDAARQETYEKIRRGGSFKRLCDNLEYISELRKQNRISCFEMAFVVQSDNRNEIVEFAKWGKKLHADVVTYSTINNWGTYTEEEFARVSLLDKEGRILKENEKYFEGLEEYKEIVNLANFGKEEMRKGVYLDYNIKSPII